ncbi:MAG: ABC transporter permease [Solirubrobacteraceae bacterium]|jgi:putative ABC transport system permease protein
MLGLITTNLTRRLGRTILTSFGVGVGVATIVALLALSAGLTQTAAGFIHLGGSDLGVFQAGVADPTASRLPMAVVKRLDSNPDVASATPLLLLVNAVKRSQSSIVFGADPHGFFSRRLVYVSGHPSIGREVEIGDGLASQLKLGPGGELTVDGRRFVVAGVYHSGVAFEDLGAVLPLTVAQQISGLQGQTTSVAVELASGILPSVARRSIQHQLPGALVIADAGEAARAGANEVLIQNATLVIIIIALIVGAISVTNTMAMSVLERQGELALLGAMGWSARRVATLVVGEGVGVSLLGAALGLLLGVIGSQLLVSVMGVGTYVTPSITAWILGRGLLVGVSIGVLGGIYPAWRVTQMPPLRGLARA